MSEVKGEYAWLKLLSRELDREAAALRRRHPVMRSSETGTPSKESHNFIRGSAHVPISTVSHNDGTVSLYSFGQLTLGHASRETVERRSDAILAAIRTGRGPVECAVARPDRLERMAATPSGPQPSPRPGLQEVAPQRVGPGSRQAASMARAPGLPAGWHWCT
jgi:hypothetical protein